MHRFGSDLKLLVATDLTSRSDRAVERAVILARAWKAPLTVLHVVSDELPRTVLRSRIEESEVILDAQASSWREGGTDITCSVLKGHDYETIVEQARELDARFIIMGSHRKVLMREYWFGTTVDKVVRFSDRPALVVRQKPLRAYEKILVATDFSEPSRSALEFSLLLFPSARITLLHAFHVPFKAFQPSKKTANQIEELQEQKMKNLIGTVISDFRSRYGELGSEVVPLLEEGFPTQIVHSQVKKLKPDLVVIGTHGHTGIRQAVLGSVAEDLISSLQTDVLAVRPLHTP